VNPTSHREHYLGAPESYRLDQACRQLVDAFGAHVFLCGSSLERPDYRDVDVRAVLKDEDFARLFPPNTNTYCISGLWSLICASVSLNLSQATGLKIDFQIQSWSEHVKHDKRCVVLGWVMPRQQPEEIQVDE